MNRREALTSAAAALAVGSLTATGFAQPAAPASVAGPALLTPEQLGWDVAKGEFVLPKLPYAPESLEPHIDKQTMEIHHGKHHAAYIAGLNKALAELKKIREGQGDAALVKHWSREVSFHGSGHVNHALFWQMLAPTGKGGGGDPTGPLANAITAQFGGIDKFVAHFKAAAAQVEGGGWAWLVVEPVSKSLLIIQQEKQQDMMLTGGIPILGVDVWEHAYYLKYQNKRADYITAFFNVINWGFVSGLYAKAVG
jgi:superoxide dismutase, Fe-Mn family